MDKAVNQLAVNEPLQEAQKGNDIGANDGSLPQHQDVHPDIIKGLQNYFESLHLASTDVQLKRLTGFSNQIFLTKIQKHEVIVKKKTHNKGCQLFVEYEDEIKRIVKENQFGPLNHYEDAEIVIEELIPGDTMKIEQTYSPGLMLLSFEQAAKFNSMKLSLENKKKLNQESVMFLDLLKRGARDQALKKLQRIVTNSTPESAARIEKARAMLEFLEDEGRLQRAVELANSFSKAQDDALIVLGHNDMFRMNLMVNAESTEVTLIDYEYSGLNPVGWDVVNYFVETCMAYKDATNTFELEIRFPDRASLVRIYEHYLEALRRYRVKYGEKCSAAELEQVDTQLAGRLAEEFPRAATVINYCWIVWCGLVASEDSRDERWPVLDYTLQRMELHERLESGSVPAGEALFPESVSIN